MAGSTLHIQKTECPAPPRLVELLLEVTVGDAAAKRKSRLALADAMGSLAVGYATGPVAKGTYLKI